MTNHDTPASPSSSVTSQINPVNGAELPIPTTPPDPDDTDMVPATRGQRHDGWTPDRQRAFIGTLADTGSVSDAAQAVGMSRRSCYSLRRSKKSAAFAAAWDAAIGQASRMLADIAFDRAINGVEQHVVDRDGNVVYTHLKTNDRLLMFLLRSHNPLVYGQGIDRLPSLDNREENGVDPVERLLSCDEDGADELAEDPTGDSTENRPGPTEAETGGLAENRRF